MPGDDETADATDDDRVTIALIAAVAANGVIGADGGMPWHLPADLRHFKRTTTGHPVVMGRCTYESIAADIGGPLPDRTNVVLSRSDPDVPEEVVVVDSVDAAVDAASDAAQRMGVETVYVAGGGRVYEQFLPRADRLVLTKLHESHEGDTTFPEFEREAWVEVERDAHEAFDFVVYERRS